VKIRDAGAGEGSCILRKNLEITFVKDVYKSTGNRYYSFRK
jgi:hypothetical protein